MKKKHTRPFYEKLIDNHQLPEFDQFIDQLRDNSDYWISGLTGSSKALFTAHIFQRTARPMLLIENTIDTAENMVDDLTTFLGPDRVIYFPDWEITPYEGRSPHESALGARLDAMHRMLCNDNCIWVATVQSLARRIPEPAFLLDATIYLKKGKRYNLETLIQRFVEIGFRREKKVEDVNSFAIRGDILDFFTYTHQNPVRVEFWDDHIDDIRLFDVYNQRSIEPINELAILPAGELFLLPDHIESGLQGITKRKREFEQDQRQYRRAAFEDKKDFELEEEADRMLDMVDGDPDRVIDKLRENISFEGQEEYFPFFIPKLTTLIDYLPKSAYILFDERSDVIESGNRFWKKIQQQYIKSGAMRRPMPRPEIVFVNPDSLIQQCKDRIRIDMTWMHLRPPVENVSYHQRMEIKGQDSVGGHLNQASDMLRELVRGGYHITIFADNRGQMERLKSMLEDVPY
ncbi:MAG: hypothetical protein B6244_12670 [Candidatus Cloacimonetes bacterium 4572_55]|nr:MAG: hypothetical protein B6244_12670 [Candidatus Cloacimonetes bacterium 4572_55]